MLIFDQKDFEKTGLYRLADLTGQVFEFKQVTEALEFSESFHRNPINAQFAYHVQRENLEGVAS